MPLYLFTIDAKHVSTRTNIGKFSGNIHETIYIPRMHQVARIHLTDIRLLDLHSKYKLLMFILNTNVGTLGLCIVNLCGLLDSLLTSSMEAGRIGRI